MISADKALYIKLGTGGKWERACLLTDQTLRLGYQEIPHDLCLAGDWAEVERIALTFSRDQGAACRHARQVRLFYEEPEATLWITFYADCLYWCHASVEIQLLPDGTKQRRAVPAWSSRDAKGELLHKSRLSGNLLALEAFRGTICSVRDIDYLLHKLNGILSPELATAQAALHQLDQALSPLISGLRANDFELLVDLIFRQAGWQRVATPGGHTKDIDLDLLAPLSGERVAVQVKSRATAQLFEEYRRKFADMQGYTRFYFVTHTTTPALDAHAEGNGDFVLWGPRHVARQVVCYGLVQWVFDRAS